MTRPILTTAFFVCALQFANIATAQSLPGNDDLRALRYYIQNNEVSAVQAEIQRLQIEFPGWTPPANTSDLSQADPSGEIAEIYARLARGDVGGARSLMDRATARFPEWKPPAALVNQLQLAEGQLAFDRAVSARNAAAAVQIGTQFPILFRCDRINNAWNLADLQARSGNKARALAAYSQIVKTCNSTSELVATIEKAEAVTSDPQLVTLANTAKSRFPAQSATYDRLIERLLAGRGRGTQRAVPTPVAAAPVAPVAARKKPTQTHSQPADRAVEPVTHTPASIPSYGSGPKLGSLPRSGDSRIRQARSSKESGNFRECLARSAQPRSLDVAYERAWCAYNADRSLEALAYFTAAAQGGLGAGVTRDARFGMALALLKRSMVDDAAQIASSTDLTLEQRKEVEVIILDQRGVTAFKNNQFRDSIDYFDALERMDGSLRRDLAMLRGYAYLRLGQRQQAEDQFQALHNILATPESRRALSSLE